MPNAKFFSRISMLLISISFNLGLKLANAELAPVADRSVMPSVASENSAKHLRLIELPSPPGIATAESTGAISLTWTAPGDDSSSGTADHYVIKYSNGPISDSNWDQAFEAPNPPTPLEAGNAQTYTLANLENGRRYYIAIKTFDEAGNISQISNIANIYASGIMAPTLAGAQIDTASNSAVLFANTVESGMSVFYEFAVDTSANFIAPVFDIDLTADSLASVAFANLQAGLTYHWRARAVAVGRTDSSAWSSSASFYIYNDTDTQSPTVAVVSPNGGETLEAGSNHIIRWTAADNIGVVSCRIEFSTNNGSSWAVLQNWSPVTDSLVWTVPTTPSSQCLIRVLARDSTNNTGSDISNGAFSIIVVDNSPVVNLLSPNGGEILLTGQTYTIRWNATDDIGVTSCRVEFSSNNGGNWNFIQNWFPATDSLVWTVPSEISDQCLIRVTARDASGNAGNDISDSLFAIADEVPPIVNLHSPNGRERWDVNSMQTVIWADSGNTEIEEFQLEYSTNGGSNWQNVCGWTPGNPHNYSWTLPDTPSKRSRVRISCRDINGNVASDASNQNFTIRDISGPRVNLLFPHEGDSLETGLDTVIIWSAEDNMGIDSFMIEYTLDNGNTWDTIIPWQQGNPEEFSWNIPPDITGDCRIRMSCRDEYDNITSDTSGIVVIHDDIDPIVHIKDIVLEDSVTLGWSARDNGLISHFLVDYTLDGGENWIEVISGPGGDSGQATFPIPDQIPAMAIRVTCYDMAENAGADTFVVEPTSVDDGGAVPSDYYVGQSYPNPFNPSTTIEYGIPEAALVTVEVFDITGARVALLEDNYQQPGSYNIVWDAAGMTSGTYFYRVSAGKFIKVGKAMLLK